VYELKVVVTKVLGTCTASPPMKVGDYITVRDGTIAIPEGGYICIWALQSLMPVLTTKERRIAESRDEDWVWRVHHVQCPDPKGRVTFRIVRSGDVTPHLPSFVQTPPSEHRSDALLDDLRVRVEEVRGRCTSGMAPGDLFTLRSGRIYIPAGRRFCLYALQAALPLLPAKQRATREGDWLRDETRLICPDPAGNVIMRVERMR